MDNKEFKPIDLENYKPSVITRIGYKIDMAKAIYKQFGIKEGIAFIYRMTKINLFKFVYRHCKWYRNKVHNSIKVNSNNAIWIIMLNMFYNRDKTFNVKDVVNAMSDEDKEKWKEQALKGINKTIELNKVTDEEQLVSLYEMYGLDYNEIKNEQEEKKS